MKYLETKNGSLQEAVLEAVKSGKEKEVKMAIGIASDPRYKKGNMTGAVQAIEKIRSGLSNHPQVKAVLKRQNEEVSEAVSPAQQAAIAISKKEKGEKPKNEEKKVECPKCEGKGCDHCDNKGYHMSEKLDPVGKEDGDIDNDGDKDSSDKYLAKRRKAIGKAMKEEFAGWIAMYGGKKVEIKKSEAKDLYGAKMKAAQKLKVPKSKMGLLAIKPAHNESVEEDIDAMHEIYQQKQQTMRQALAQVWGVDEGKNPFMKDDEKKEKKGNKTETGQPMTPVSINPKMGQDES